MAKNVTDWDARIGRRLTLRDLHILSAVEKYGSMAKAAAHLGITQSAISQSIGELEATVGVRLLDRGPRGVAPTLYGEALLRRSTEAFDALRQAIREVESLADAEAGEVWIGVSESHVSGGYLAAAVADLARQYPRIVVHVVEANTAAMEFLELRNRSVDLMLGRISGPVTDDDLHVETLFHEPIVVAAGAQNRWVQRRKVGLAELSDEPWILAPPNTAVRELVGAAFRAKGLTPPRPSVTTYSMQLRIQLLATGNYITAVPASLLRYNAERWSLVALPVSLGQSLPVVAVTLRNRTLNPAVRLFIEHARAATKQMQSTIQGAPAS